MKKVLLITFVAACFCQSISAHNNAKIDVALQQELLLHKASELIGIDMKK
jgi:hypothetical protein